MKGLLNFLVDFTLIDRQIQDCNSQIDELNNKLSEQNKVLEKQQSQILELQDKIKVLSEKQKSFSEVNSTNKVASHSTQAKTNDLKAGSDQKSVLCPSPKVSELVFKSEYLYFGAPMGNGFIVDYVLDSQSNMQSLYELETKSSNTAEFSLLTSKYGRLVKNVPSLMQPLCDISGVSIDESNGIVVEKPGIMQKEGNQWVLKEKCKVKFI